MGRRAARLDRPLRQDPPRKHEAQVELDRQSRLPAPAPLPGDGDKGIASAAKRVDPLRSQTGLSRAAIIESLKQTFVGLYGATPGTVTPDELAEAEELVETKFATREWLYRVP